MHENRKIHETTLTIWPAKNLNYSKVFLTTYTKTAK